MKRFLPPLTPYNENMKDKFLDVGDIVLMKHESGTITEIEIKRVTKTLAIGGDGMKFRRYWFGGMVFWIDDKQYSPFRFSKKNSPLS